MVTIGYQPISPEEFTERAQYLRYNKQYTLAFSDLKALAESSPNVPYILYQLGVVCRLLQDFKLAVAYLTKQIEQLERDLQGDDWDGDSELHNTYLMACHHNRMLLYQQLAKGDKSYQEGAQQDSRALNTLTNRSAVGWLNLARFHVKNHDWELAKAAIDQAMVRNNKFAPGLAEQAWIFHSTGDKKKGLNLYRQALGVATEKDLTALLGRGLLLMQEGKFENAEKDFTQAVKDHPFEGIVYLRRGDMYLVNGQTSQALHDYQQMFVVEKGMHLPPLNCALISDHTRDKRFICGRTLAIAVEVYQAVLIYLQTEPAMEENTREHARVHWYLAMTYKALGDVNKFVEYVKKVFVLDSDFLSTYLACQNRVPVDFYSDADGIWLQSELLLRITYWTAGEHTPEAPISLAAYFDVLLEHYEAQSHHRNTLVAWHFARGHFYRLSKLFDKATTDFYRALDYNHDFHEAVFEVAQLEIDILNLDKAIEALTQAIESVKGLEHPDRPSSKRVLAKYLSWRGWIYRTQCNYPQAKMDCKAALELEHSNRLAHFQVALIHIFSGKIAEAIKPLKHVTTLPEACSRKSYPLWEKWAQRAKTALFGLNVTPQIINGNVDHQKRFDTLFERAMLHLLLEDVPKALEDLVTINGSDSSYVAPSTRLLHHSYSATPFASPPLDKTLLAQTFADRAKWFANVLHWPEDAIGNHSKTIEIDPYNRDAFIARALLYKDRNNFEAAVKDLTHCIALHPQKSLGYHYRSLLYMKIGELDKALQDLDVLVELMPEHSATFKARGMMHMEMGNIEDAVADLQRVVVSEQAESDAVAEGVVTQEHAEARLALAQCYVQQKRLTEAVLQYDQVLESDPSNYNALAPRAHVHMLQGSYDLAYRDYSRCIMLQEDNWGVYYARARVLQAMAKFTEALEDYILVSRNDPDHPGLHNNMGVVYQATGDIDRAAQCYSTAIHLNPNDVNARFNKAIVERCQGNYDDALSNIARVLELDPEMTSAIYERGKIYFALKQYTKAAEDFEFALDDNPNLIEAMVHLGYIKQLQGEPAEAIALYNKVLTKQPKHAIALTYRGHLLATQGKIEEGLNDVERAIMYDPHGGIPHRYRGIINRMLANDDAALADYLVTLKDSSQVSGEIHDEVGQIYLRKKEYEKALEHFYEASQLSPDNATTLNNRGLALLGVGSVEMAMEDFSQACKLQPTFVDALNNLGIVLEMLRNPGEAMVRFQRVIEIDPTHGEGHFNAANAHKALKDYDVAIPLYNRAEELMNAGTPDPEAMLSLYNNRGACYHALDILDKARHDYDRALAINPENPDTLMNRGQLYLRSKQFAWAYRDFHDCIRNQSQPDEDAKQLLELSRIWLRIWRAACEDFACAIAFNPVFDDYHFEHPNIPRDMFTDTPLETEDYYDQLQAVEKHLQSHANEPEALLRKLELQTCQYPTIPILKKCLIDATAATYACPPKRVEMLIKLRGYKARVAEMLDDLPDALRTMSEARFKVDERKILYNFINYHGYLYFKNKQGKEALHKFTEAIEIDSSQHLAWINRANTHRAEGDFGAAMDDYLHVSRMLAEESDHELEKGRLQVRVYEVLSKYRETVEKGVGTDAQEYFDLQGSLAVTLEDLHVQLQDAMLRDESDRKRDAEAYAVMGADMTMFLKTLEGEEMEELANTLTQQLDEEAAIRQQYVSSDDDDDGDGQSQLSSEPKSAAWYAWHGIDPLKINDLSRSTLEQARQIDISSDESSSGGPLE